MTPNATTTEIINSTTAFVGTWAPQVFLVLLGILGVLFIWIVAKRGISFVWHKLTGMFGRR